MRIKIATFLLMAGTVVGCASNPPPPPPMVAAAPEPMMAPAPVTAGPVMGTYTGMAEASGTGRACRASSRATTVRVGRNNTFALAGIRGMIGPDGTISSRGRGGRLSGTATAGGLDVTAMKGRCTYHYMLTKA